MLSKNSHFGHSVFNTWKHFFLFWGGGSKSRGLVWCQYIKICVHSACAWIHIALCVFFFAFLKHFKLCTDFASVAQGDGSVSTDMPEAQLLVPAVPQVMTSSRCHASFACFFVFFCQCLQEWCINIHLFHSLHQAFHLLPLCMSRG